MKNNYEIEGNVVRIYLSNCEDYFICDLEDLEKAKQYTWRKDRDGYAVATINRKAVSFHIFLLGRKSGLEIDHKNRKKLDNRKSNLHFVTHLENMRNTTLIKDRVCGVSRRYGKYIASIHINCKTTHLGCFDTLEEAIRARKQAEAFYWGNQADA